MNPFASAFRPKDIVIPTNSTNNSNQETMTSPVETQVTNSQTTVTNEVVVPTVTNQEVNNVEVAEVGKFDHLINFHENWGTDKIVTISKEGKVARNKESVLSFLNWLDKVEVNGNCLEKPEVLHVIKNKLTVDMGIKATNIMASKLWDAMGLTPWQKRINVKSGYTRNKLDYDWN